MSSTPKATRTRPEIAQLIDGNGHTTWHPLCTLSTPKSRCRRLAVTVTSSSATQQVFSERSLEQNIVHKIIIHSEARSLIWNIESRRKTDSCRSLEASKMLRSTRHCFLGFVFTAYKFQQFLWLILISLPGYITVLCIGRPRQDSRFHSWLLSFVSLNETYRRSSCARMGHCTTLICLVFYLNDP